MNWKVRLSRGERGHGISEKSGDPRRPSRSSPQIRTSDLTSSMMVTLVNEKSTSWLLLYFHHRFILDVEPCVIFYSITCNKNVADTKIWKCRLNIRKMQLLHPATSIAHVSLAGQWLPGHPDRESTPSEKGRLERQHRQGRVQCHASLARWEKPNLVFVIFKRVLGKEGLFRGLG